jgi:hypothetical protein
MTNEEQQKHEDAIQAWREEALTWSPDTEHIRGHVISTEALDAICDLARRSPAPDPHPSSALMEMRKELDGWEDAFLKMRKERDEAIAELAACFGYLPLVPGPALAWDGIHLEPHVVRVADEYSIMRERAEKAESMESVAANDCGKASSIIERLTAKNSRLRSDNAARNNDVLEYVKEIEQLRKEREAALDSGGQLLRDFEECTDRLASLSDELAITRKEHDEAVARAEEVEAEMTQEKAITATLRRDKAACQDLSWQRLNRADKAESDFIAVAQAAGVFYEADFMAPVAGPVEDIVAAIKQYQDDAHELIDLQSSIFEHIPYADANDERGDDDAALSAIECVESAAGDIKRLTAALKKAEDSEKEEMLKFVQADQRLADAVMALEAAGIAQVTRYNLAEKIGELAASSDGKLWEVLDFIDGDPFCRGEDGQVTPTLTYVSGAIDHLLANPPSEVASVGRDDMKALRDYDKCYMGDDIHHTKLEVVVHALVRRALREGGK